jgi:hypothetical protein
MRAEEYGVEVVKRHGYTMKMSQHQTTTAPNRQTTTAQLHRNT